MQLKSTSIKRANRMLMLFGLLKIPMIWFCRVKIVEFDNEKVVCKIPLRRKTKNHLGSMYFGALAVGADIAGGFLTFILARDNNLKLSLAFKNFKADFLERPESDVYFVCQSGQQSRDMIAQSQVNGERITQPMKIDAVTFYNTIQETKVAEFELGLSIKVKN